MNKKQITVAWTGTIIFFAIMFNPYWNPKSWWAGWLLLFIIIVIYVLINMLKDKGEGGKDENRNNR